MGHKTTETTRKRILAKLKILRRFYKTTKSKVNTSKLPKFPINLMETRLRIKHKTKILEKKTKFMFLVCKLTAILTEILVCKLTEIYEAWGGGINGKHTRRQTNFFEIVFCKVFCYTKKSVIIILDCHWVHIYCNAEMFLFCCRRFYLFGFSCQLV